VLAGLNFAPRAPACYAIGSGLGIDQNIKSAVLIADELARQAPASTKALDQNIKPNHNKGIGCIELPVPNPLVVLSTPENRVVEVRKLGLGRPQCPNPVRRGF
jgi:hypothetical protein